MSFIDLLGTILKEQSGSTYDQRKIAKDATNGLTVSTCWTDDMGYETAILDANSTYPVERYATIKEAALGHAKWLEKLPTLTTVTCLGYGELVEDKEVTLERLGG